MNQATTTRYQASCTHRSSIAAGRDKAAPITTGKEIKLLGNLENHLFFSYRPNQEKAALGSLAGLDCPATTPFDFVFPMYFLKARRFFCLLRLCKFFRASCFMLVFLARRDKPAGCLRMWVPHGEAIATNVGLE